eukprot:scaffold24702_cov137-Cylindrotheca_fusiformis.AAC.2
MLYAMLAIAGNRRLRDIINQNVPIYRKAKTKTDKGKIIVDLCKQLIVSSPTKTGFVKLDPKTGRWFFIGYEKSKDKVGHALRKATARSKTLKSKAQEQQQEQEEEERRQEQQQQDEQQQQQQQQQQGTSRGRSASDEDPQNRLQRELLSSCLPPSESSSENSDDGTRELSGSRASTIKLPSAASLPQQRTTHPSSSSLHKEPSILRYVIGEDPEEPTNTAPSTKQFKKQAILESSPVRRSMFDSPLKSYPRMAADATDDSVTIPLPLSSSRTTNDETTNHQPPPQRLPRDYEGPARGVPNDPHVSPVAGDVHSSGPPSTYMQPSPYAHPHFFYGPPPSAYVYYP